MKRFDLCWISAPRGPQLAVHLQSEFFDFLETRLVAPVFEGDAAQAIGRVTPVIKIDGRTHLVRLDLMLTVPAAAIAPAPGSLSEARDDITRALDRLMQGF